MKKIIFTAFLTCNLFASEDLGVVEVKDSKSDIGFASVFDEPNYEDRENFVESMPAQTRLTKEEAMFMPGTQGDPLKALTLIGGVTSLGGGSGELFIYGSKPEESVYTINHLPVGYIQHLGGVHSVISPESISQLDAYLGGFDVTYGNAMGGVIDITPEYSTSDKTSAYGHIGLYDASFGANVAITDKLSFYLGGRRSYIDALVPVETFNNSDESNNSLIEVPNFYDLTFMMSYNFNANNHFSLEVISAHDDLKLNAQDNAVKDPAATGDVLLDYGFTTVGARWEYYNKNYSANTLLYNLNSDAVTEFYGHKGNSKTNNLGLFHQSNLEFDEHKIVAGIEYINYKFDFDFNTTGVFERGDESIDITSEDSVLISRDITTQSYSAFLEDIYTPSYNWSIRYGLRFNYSPYQNYGSALDPRLSILYKLNANSNLSFSTGKYSQFPDPSKGLEEIGNKNISYESAWHYILHYDIAPTSKLHVVIEPYYKDFDDLAVEDNASAYLNAGDGYAYGFDTSLKYRDGRYYAFLTYTYLQTKREFSTADSQPQRTYLEVPHTLQAIGGWRFANNWSFSTLAQYHSGIAYSEVIDTYSDEGRIRPIYGETYGARLPDYFSLNLKIAQQLKFAHSELEWSFEIMNITNHENITDIRYNDDYTIEGYNQGFGLTTWFDVTYRF